MVCATLAPMLLGLSTVGETATHESFFKDKSIRIVVGAPPGGGFDTYSRAIARHMGRHIPGNPAIIVENMPGAGSLIAANHVYKVARPDGLTFAQFIGGLLLGQVLGQKGIEFDARKFEYLGNPVKEYPACAFTKASGITSLEKWMAAKTPPKLGGVAVGVSNPDNAIKIFKAGLGLPLQLVSGYKGTAPIRLAAESGELAGSCWGWNSVKSTWRKALDAGEVSIVLQAAPTPYPDLPGVPLAITLAKTDETRKMLQVAVHDDGAIVRVYAFPPGTPKDRMQTLRKAFLETMRDPEFLADAKKAKLDIDPVSGEEIERIAAGLFTLDPALVAKLKDLLLQ
jgi:tripartite-type tricarboxylate transporter receptor subunit TctC